MSRHFRRKPDGTLTTNAESYIDAWDQLSVPLEKALGLKRVAFDPGLLMRDEENPDLVVEIPCWLAVRIIDRFL